MTQQNVSDTLKKVYPRFVSFRYIAEQNPDVSETTLRMNLQRMYDGGVVCKTTAIWGKKRKTFYSLVPQDLDFVCGMKEGEYYDTTDDNDLYI